MLIVLYQNTAVRQEMPSFAKSDCEAPSEIMASNKHSNQVYGL